MLVLRIDEFGPWLSWNRVLRKQVFIVGVKRETILVQVGVELLSAEHLGDFDELIVVVTSLEERFALEDHACKHAAERPDIKRVVIGLQINEQLGPLEVSGSDAHIILLAWVVELS